MTAGAPAIDIELLEPILQRFVELTDLDATMAIVAKHGGTLLNIARKADENAALVALVGREHAATLGREYGGERPFIPKALPALRALRNRALAADLETMSIRQVARKYGIGERQVCYIAKALPDERTGDLFG